MTSAAPRHGADQGRMAGSPPTGFATDPPVRPLLAGDVTTSVWGREKRGRHLIVATRGAPGMLRG